MQVAAKSDIQSAISSRILAVSPRERGATHEFRFRFDAGDGPMDVALSRLDALHLCYGLAEALGNPIHPCDPVSVQRGAPSSWLTPGKEQDPVKRDMELVRTIFRAVIDRKDMKPEELKLEGHDPYDVGAHVSMLYDNGYINGIASQDNSSDYKTVFIRDLSWQGHEFAGAIIADEGVWQKVKGVFGPEMLATVPLKMIEGTAMSLLTAWVKEKTGL